MGFMGLAALQSIVDMAVNIVEAVSKYCTLWSGVQIVELGLSVGTMQYRICRTCVRGAFCITVRLNERGN